MISLENLADTVVPIVAISFVVAIAAVNLFLSVRKCFPVGVNCWFCNTNHRVPYADGNSWVCPSCTQYNGFNEEGDYNREIPAQYQCQLNPRTNNITDDDKIFNSGSVLPNNGLCFGCNRNQELKIYQLASFVPEKEENYDEEVEEYERQLEQTYKLCARCERVLKRKLNDVKRNILGSKLAQIGTKGLKVFDMHMQANDKQVAYRKKKSVADACLWAIILILILKIGQRASQMEIRKESLEKVFGQVVSQMVLMIVSYLIALKQTLFVYWSGMMDQPVVVESVQQLKNARTVLMEKWGQKLDLADGICEVFSDVPEVVGQENGLTNMALICLIGMLITIKSHISKATLILLLLCCGSEVFLKSEYGVHVLGNSTWTPAVELVVSIVSLMAAIGCIGKTTPKIQSSDRLDSSFHKIYSQHSNEADSSNSCDDQSSLLNDSSICSVKGGLYASSIGANMSVRSMDTTKSISPSVLTASTLRPFQDYSFQSQISPNSHYGGSVLAINRLHDQQQPARSFSRISLITPENSLAKTPSYSVDNFTTAMADRLNVSMASPRIGYSMNSISGSSYRQKDLEDRFGEDIDRLSISGRLTSLSRRDLSMVMHRNPERPGSPVGTGDPRRKKDM
ncbi:uncharacterized protein LOC129753351 isoform X2 [Uranotaenia lowii]|uniref:uncharacterized protein LOC129753351 isoform X2 n=1 Tax=Uranotaenia lowii TaxID=190385 RepID=UPI0024791CAF|nr:uncharacterized protein LOC129753351 isoform X2 [Uranotaenia lowii]